MNHTILTEWFTSHHPDVAVEVERWEANLPRHDPHDLTTTLNAWHHAHPEIPPKPADIHRLLRRGAMAPHVAALIKAAHQALADSRDRAGQADRPNPLPVCTAPGAPTQEQAS